jgi:hypothetical protein
MNRAFPMMNLPSEAPPGSRIHGYDRPQYAFDTYGVPEAVIDAAHIGLLLVDIDVRQCEWMEGVL